MPWLMVESLQDANIGDHCVIADPMSESDRACGTWNGNGIVIHGPRCPVYNGTTLTISYGKRFAYYREVD